MTKEDKIQIIDTTIAMMCDGTPAKEIAEALNIKEEAVRVIESKLDIWDAFINNKDPIHF